MLALQERGHEFNSPGPTQKPVISGLGRWTQADPWGELANRLCLLGKLQWNERPGVKIISGEELRSHCQVFSLAATCTHMPLHTCLPEHMCEPAHTCVPKHTCAPAHISTNIHRAKRGKPGAVVQSVEYLSNIHEVLSLIPAQPPGMMLYDCNLSTWVV